MALSKRTSIKDLEEVIEGLVERISALEEGVRESEPRVGSSINKVETFNGEEEPAQRESSGMKMDENGKMASVKNACMILPPNLKVNEMHTTENVGAICGFKVSEEMVREAYRMM